MRGIILEIPGSAEGHPVTDRFHAQVLGIAGTAQTGTSVSIDCERGSCSGSGAMIKPEQPTQALTVDDIASVREERDIGIDELVSEALMRPFRIEMSAVIGECAGILTGFTPLSLRIVTN